MDREDEVARSCESDELAGLCEGQAHGLLESDVLASTEQVRRELEVGRGRRGNYDDLYVVVCCELSDTCVRSQPWELFLCGLASRRVEVARGDHFETRSRARGKPVIQPHPPVRPIPEDSESDRPVALHQLSSSD